MTALFDNLDGLDPVSDRPVRDRCRICRHRLKDPVSMQVGIGPDCRAALGITPHRQRVRLARVRDGGDVPGQGDLLDGEKMGDEPPVSSEVVCEGADGWGVVLVENGDSSFQTHPCPACPWRKDAPVGAFPPEVFRHSARTTYDLADTVFGCHASTSARPKTCAGFLLRGALDNLLIRMGRADHSGVHSTVALYENYRAMAIANGVAPDDPALAPCRGNRSMEYLPHREKD